MNIYVKNGFSDRQEYLEYLSEQYEVDISMVQEAAFLLGKEEDFDGLPAVLGDI